MTQHSDEYEAIKKISASLNEQVVGQPRAVKEIEKALFKVVAGLNNENRPLGVYFFAGPSRTGKTMAAIALSEALLPLRKKNTTRLKLEEKKKQADEVKNFLKIINADANENNPEEAAKIAQLEQIVAGNEQNLSKQKKIFENMQADSFKKIFPGIIRIDCGILGFHEAAVSSLTSSSPGLIGSNKPGLLDPEVINNNWGCVILFDEIEKAHPAIYNVLLQIFDSGKLTLANARGEVDFTNAIIILTSNIGGAMMEKAAKGGGKIGFGLPKKAVADEADAEKKSDAAYEICTEEYQRKFSREFRNRVDRLIIFNYLSSESLKKILRIELDKVGKLVESKKPFSFKCDESAADALFKELNHFEEQAAEIVHLIERKVKSPLSALIVKGVVKDGDTLILSADAKGKLKFKIFRKKSAEGGKK